MIRYLIAGLVALICLLLWRVDHLAQELTAAEDTAEQYQRSTESLRATIRTTRELLLDNAERAAEKGRNAAVDRLPVGWRSGRQERPRRADAAPEDRASDAGDRRAVAHDRVGVLCGVAERRCVFDPAECRLRRGIWHMPGR